MSPQLPTDAVQFLIDQGLAASRINIVWHAGEPLAAGIPFYEQALQIFSEKISHPISHSAQTNGTLISPEWIAFLKRHPNFSFGISLDGPQFLHDAHRKFRSGKGSFELAIRGLKLLQDAGFNPHPIAVISSLSLDYPDEIYDFFEAHQVPSLALNIEEEEGINRSKTLYKSQFYPKYCAFFKRIYERSLTGKLKIREVEAAKNAIFQNGIEENVLVEPFRYVSVDYLGNFSTYCPELLGAKHEQYDSFVLGNIYSTTLEQVISSERFEKMRSEIARGVKQCEESCEYFFVCKGGTPINKLYENGSFATTVTHYCRSSLQIPMEQVLSELEKEALLEKHGAGVKFL